MSAETPKNGLFLSDINPLYRAGTGILATIIGEQTKGRVIKKQLGKEVNSMLDDPRFSDGKEGKSHKTFLKKLDQFRPRMIGAFSLYCAFSGESYDEIAKNEGIEAFYLFWRLADGQDDLIDAPKKHNEDDKRPLKERIFKDDNGEFLRGAMHLLENKIAQGRMGNEEKLYLKKKVAGWYRFLSEQEQRIQSEDVSAFDFNYCKSYREDQNQKAGAVLVALLNWDKCLDPKFQELETIIPKFSFTTQMMDDIGDTVEDVEAKRPSFATGALRDTAEFEKFLDVIKKRGIKKVHPSLFREFAPRAYGLLREQFREYCRLLEIQSGIKGRGFSQIANSVFLYFPSVRDFLYKLNPGIANF